MRRGRAVRLPEHLEDARASGPRPGSGRRRDRRASAQAGGSRSPAASGLRKYASIARFRRSSGAGAHVQRDAVADPFVLSRVVGGLHDGVGDPLDEKIEEGPVEPGPQGGEGVVERRGHVVRRGRDACAWRRGSGRPARAERRARRRARRPSLSGRPGSRRARRRRGRPFAPGRPGRRRRGRGGASSIRAPPSPRWSDRPSAGPGAA